MVYAIMYCHAINFYTLFIVRNGSACTFFHFHYMAMVRRAWKTYILLRLPKRFIFNNIDAFPTHTNLFEMQTQFCYAKTNGAYRMRAEFIFILLSFQFTIHFVYFNEGNLLIFAPERKITKKKVYSTWFFLLPLFFFIVLE